MRLTSLYLAALGLWLCLLSVIAAAQRSSERRNAALEQSLWMRRARRLPYLDIPRRFKLRSKKPVVGGVKVARYRALSARTGPLSRPLIDGRDYASLTRKALKTHEGTPVLPRVPTQSYESRAQCELDLTILWKHRLERGIYATPRVESLTSLGEDTIIIPSLHEDLTLLARNGHIISGFPISYGEGVTSQTSPLVFDVDGDGRKDIITVSTDGQIFVLHNAGLLVSRQVSTYLDDETSHETFARRNFALDRGQRRGRGRRKRAMPQLQGVAFEIPKLRVSRYWRSGASTGGGKNGQQLQKQEETAKVTHRTRKPLSIELPSYDSVLDTADYDDESHWEQGRGRPKPNNATRPGEMGLPMDIAMRIALAQNQDSFSVFADPLTPNIVRGVTVGTLPVAETVSSRDDSLLFSRKPLPRSNKGNAEGPSLSDGSVSSSSRTDLLGGSKDESPTPRSSSASSSSSGSGLPASIYDTPANGEYLWIDAHVHSTPTHFDVDGDGYQDLIITVSYYYDSSRSHDKLKHVPPGVNYTDYSAGGVVTVSLKKQKLLWSQHLDLTTMYGDGDHLPSNSMFDSSASGMNAHSQLGSAQGRMPRNAQIHASPIVADIDGDGQLEVIVGTGLGYVYALNVLDGELKSGFPKVISSAPILTTPALEDLVGDGKSRMVLVDGADVIHCVDASTGMHIWRRQLDAPAARSVTFGDVDGDGELDVVLATIAGGVWALRGRDGEVLPGYPLQVDGRVLAPVTLASLTPTLQDILASAITKGTHHIHRHDHTKGGESPNDEFLSVWTQSMIENEAFKKAPMHLIVPALDGKLYIIAGRNASCVQSVDIGSPLYSAAVVGDISGRGLMDVLVASMSGDVTCLGSRAPASGPTRLGSGRAVSPALPDTGSVTAASVVGVKVLKVRSLGFLPFSSVSNHESGTSMSSSTDVIGMRTASTMASALAQLLAPAIAETRRMKHFVTGSAFELHIFIEDHRPYTQKWLQSLTDKDATDADHRVLPQPLYEVLITYEDETVQAGHSSYEKGMQRDYLNRSSVFTSAGYGRVIMRQIVRRPGLHVFTLPSPHSPVSSLVTVHVSTAQHQIFKDSVSISFNSGYHSLLKYLILAPFLILFGLFILAPAARSSAKPKERLSA